MSYDKSYARIWRQKNKDKIAEYNRRRRECRRHYKQRRRLKFPDESREYLQRWFKANPGKRNSYRAAYEARKKQATHLLTVKEKAQVAAFYVVSKLMTLNTGVSHHVDHIVPISRGGLHHPFNLQILTADKNRRKNAKLEKGKR